MALLTYACAASDVMDKLISIFSDHTLFVHTHYHHPLPFLQSSINSPLQFWERSTAFLFALAGLCVPGVK
jgi:hypothetical protein